MNLHNERSFLVSRNPIWKIKNEPSFLEKINEPPFSPWVETHHLSLCTCSTDNLKRVYIWPCHKWSQISRSRVFQSLMSNNCCLSINYSVHSLQTILCKCITQWSVLVFLSYISSWPHYKRYDWTPLWIVEVHDP